MIESRYTIFYEKIFSIISKFIPNLQTSQQAIETSQNKDEHLSHERENKISLKRNFIEISLG